MDNEKFEEKIVKTSDEQPISSEENISVDQSLDKPVIQSKESSPQYATKQDLDYQMSVIQEGFSDLYATFNKEKSKAVAPTKGKITVDDVVTHEQLRKLTKETKIQKENDDLTAFYNRDGVREVIRSLSDKLKASKNLSRSEYARLNDLIKDNPFLNKAFYDVGKPSKTADVTSFKNTPRHKMESLPSQPLSSSSIEAKPSVIDSRVFSGDLLGKLDPEGNREFQKMHDRGEIEVRPVGGEACFVANSARIARRVRQLI